MIYDGRELRILLKTKSLRDKKTKRKETCKKLLERDETRNELQVETSHAARVLCDARALRNRARGHGTQLGARYLRQPKERAHN